MDSCGKRLGIAMTAVVVLLGLNAFAVVSGAADGAYERLLGKPVYTRVAASGDNPSVAEPMVEPAECVRSYPKPLYPEALSLAVGARAEPGAPARICGSV